MIRTTRSATVLLVTLVVASCSIIYATSSSEENLLCGPDDGTPRCLDGYTCVRANDVERCVLAGFKDVGDPCLTDAECSNGGVCADAYAELCPAGSTDINCGRVDDATRGLRCRAPCDAQSGFSCGDDDRCFFFEGLDPFCQPGTCASDTDCEGGAVPALCVGERGGGRNGFCVVACDPLACFDGNCPCAAGEGCAMPADEVAVSTRNVCSAAGVIPPGAACDVLNPCVEGSSCVFRNDGTAVCVQWCRVGGGAPACDAGVCQGVQQGSVLGICQ
jgi:hypothetical protein